MISFKNIKSLLSEKLILKKRPGPEGKTIFIASSDLADPKEAGNETFKNKDFIKTLGFKWNALERRWETSPLDENQSNDFVKNTIKKLNEFNKEESSDGDYGSIPSFYTSLRVGEWDKPFKVVARTAPTVRSEVARSIKVEGTIQIVNFLQGKDHSNPFRIAARICSFVSAHDK